MVLIKKKISIEKMSFVVYKTAKERTKSIIECLDKNISEESDYNGMIFVLLSYFYNVFIIKKTLQQKYDVNIVSIIIKNVTDFLYESISLKEPPSFDIITIRDDIFDIVDNVLSQKYSGGFDNPIRELSKILLSNSFSPDFADSCGEILIFEITIEITSWFHNDFLLDDFKITL